MLDSFAKVYDLREKKQLAPISFPGGAAYVQMHPKMSTAGVIASQGGQVQTTDIHNPNSSTLHHAGIFYPNLLLGIVMAPSGLAWAMNDQENTVHLWGAAGRLQFAEIKQATEFADTNSISQSIPWEGDQ